MNQKRNKLGKFSIRTKLLMAFLGLSLVALIVLGFVALNGIATLNSYSLQSSQTLGENAVADSTVALAKQAEEYLLRLALDQADISNNIFEQVEAEMKITAQLAQTILASSTLDSKTLYSQQQRPPNIYEATVYVLAPNVELDNVSNELNYTSHMEDAFKSIHKNNPLLTQLYIGTESGILQLYPWSTGINTSYDPRLRDWYINAKQTGEIYWSEPYIDAGGHGLMVTCSIPVSSPQKGFFWVIGADVTIQTINQKIINTQIGELGYAFLLDNKGNVIARPELSSEDKKWDESFETGNMLLSDNPALAAIAKNMTEGKKGITMCSLSDGDKYIAYAPLNNTKWSMAIVLPVEEIIAPALNTQSKINEYTDETSTIINLEAEKVRNTYLILFIIIIFMVAATSLLLARTIVNPITTLIKGAKALGSGDLDSRVHINSGDELETLAGSFNKMADDLQEYMVELQRTTAEKTRLIKELEIAKGIQRSFLPEKEPDISGIDIAASNVAATEVGGDFYDFIPIAKDQWGLTIADVAGKGVPAALFMALSRTLVRASTTGNPNVSESIEKANELICADAKTGMFVTLFYAILDAKKKRLRYVNAGHNPPLLLKQQKGNTVLLKAKGIALGVIENIELEEEEIQLEKGDLITLFTDGVTEAINQKEEQFGQQRLLTLIEENRGLSACEIISKIEAEVTAFSGGQPQFDDITLMIIKIA
ncbi:MAG: SpoIIE family protein phosphatase [Candidatus Bathyarchaeota archaeon]|nr:SpoIIE family protein phosphatase [Candidatus Bathyarchaeota archaeon]MDI9578789.1 SpoIIE family protein phosphatase [Thermoproteota archaeon]